MDRHRSRASVLIEAIHAAVEEPAGWSFVFDQLRAAIDADATTAGTCRARARDRLTMHFSLRPPALKHPRPPSPSFALTRVERE